MRIELASVLSTISKRSSPFHFPKFLFLFTKNLSFVKILFFKLFYECSNTLRFRNSSWQRCGCILLGAGGRAACVSRWVWFFHVFIGGTVWFWILHIFNSEKVAFHREGGMYHGFWDLGSITLETSAFS